MCDCILCYAICWLCCISAILVIIAITLTSNLWWHFTDKCKDMNCHRYIIMHSHVIANTKGWYSTGVFCRWSESLHCYLILIHSFVAKSVLCHLYFIKWVVFESVIFCNCTCYWGSSVRTCILIKKSYSTHTIYSLTSPKRSECSSWWPTYV